MIAGSSLNSSLREALRTSCDAMLAALKSERMYFWSHWAALAEVYLPRRYKYFVTPNQANRGAQMNAQIVDETGVLAARTLASGLMSGLTSPTRPWFRLRVPGSVEPFGPGAIWCSEVERLMMQVFAESNFYQSLGNMYHDCGVFATSNMLIYEDPDDIIRCYNPVLGEFYCGASDSGIVDTLYREYAQTVRQVVSRFGIENVPETVADSYRGGSAQQVREVVVCHAIEPNTEVYFQEKNFGCAVPKKFRYREVYWIQASDEKHIIQVSGYNERCQFTARWDVNSNDAYGTGSPGMIGLPAVRQLQIEQRRKAEAIDKLVRPPMVASVNMRNEPMSILPGAINYVADLQGAGMKPAYQVEPRINELMEDIKEVQDRAKSVFFVDLFMMISELNTVRTATEIDARREEKLIQLGPVIERFENEVLDPIIDRVFAIMSRRGLLPPAPPEIAGAPIQIQYVSMLAEAQRAASTAAIERLFQFTGSLVAVFPDIIDNVDEDEAVEEYAAMLNVPPKLIRDAKAVQQIRAEKAKQQQAAQLAAAAPAAKDGAQAAQVLSQTDVGGGLNALQMMAGQA